MKELLQRYRLLCARLDARAPRERVMVHLLVVVLTWGVFDSLWFEQAHTRLKAGLAAEQAAVLQLVQVHTEIRAQQQMLEHGPNEVLQAARQRWEQQQRDQQTALKQAGHDLLPAREVVSLLQRVVVNQPALQLLGLRNLEAQPIGREGSKGEDLKPLLWQHRVEIKLLGGYADVLAYTRHLEGLDLPLRRESLLLESVSSSEQPHAVKATLVLSNWSLDPQWMSF